MYIPMNYDQINLHTGTYSPSPVISKNNLTFDFWVRALFHRAESSIILNNLPDEWHSSVKDFLFYCLFKFGYVSVFENNKFGFSFQPCGLEGINFYYQPTTAIITNPKLEARFKIGEECELLKLTPDYMGIWDIINYYAKRLAELDSGINMAIINSKFAWCAAAKNKTAAETLKKIFDKIQKGEPAVVFKDGIVGDNKDKNSPFHFFDRGSLKQSYITTDMLMDLQTVLNGFDTEIGIPVLPYQKKERMVTSEAESKVMDATSRCILWVDTLNECFKVINAKYNTNMYAEMRFKPEDENNELSKDNSDRVTKLDD